MSRSSTLAQTPAMRLEIGRKYEEGKKLRGKAILAQYGISWSTLLKCAAEYRQKYPRSAVATTAGDPI